ncbi:olfactory receptor 1-like [Erpetoichthys calabaricus]|uniref:olfactory receptor 1-like n=1 Tax=Erpetoichthys calabaricus TaxID=27687 RepID=UPI002234C023|nr:olfactory receptor 1-like [Erpetoichthys calabaricus]
MNNETFSSSEFVLHCLIEADQRRYIIAALAFIYLLSLFGNLLVIIVIILNDKLHAPMYIYIGTLAVIDLANSTILIPKMLADLRVLLSPVPYGLCFFQMSIILNVEEMESLLLTLMAFDRYVAVVHPLRYNTIVTNKRVWLSVIMMNVFVFLFNSQYLFFARELIFCRTNILPYCFCDYATMVQIACTNDPKYLLLLSVIVIITGVIPMIFILLSYSVITIAAIRISSAERKKKAFSTILTHLLVVFFFYVPLLTSYILPGAGVKLSEEAYNTMVIVGNVVPPMLNPIIYSFRNEEIRGGIYRLFTGTKTAPVVKSH